LERSADHAIASSIFRDITAKKGIPDPDDFVFGTMVQAETSYLAMTSKPFPEIWPDIESVQEIGDYCQVLTARLTELEPRFLARNGLRRLHALLPPD
jgi:hypothetical protein